MPAPEQHAALSASSSERWLNCPPSVRLSERFPKTTSPYAEAGRLAHAIAELKARKYFGPEPMTLRTYNARMKKLKADEHYDPGMDSATDAYLEHLKKLAMDCRSGQPFVTLENRVDYSEYAPGGFGTADCILVDLSNARLCISDYKNGACVLVEAEHNPQMMLYALGALKLYGPIFGDSIQQIHLSIIQPNAGGVREWDLSRSYLENWGTEVVRPAAELASQGRGEFNSGDWCRFCPAKAQCTARAKQMLELEEYNCAQPGPLLSDDQVGDVLTRAMRLESWVKELKEYALTAVLNGGAIAGFKAVEGRGSREWIDLDAAFAQLAQRGVQEALLWERKPVTPPALEKALGKNAFAAAAADLVRKKPGKPALVPESDPRGPYDPAQAAFGGGGGGDGR